jgi:hypothetical protein
MRWIQRMPRRSGRKVRNWSESPFSDQISESWLKNESGHARFSVLIQLTALKDQDRPSRRRSVELECTDTQLLKHAFAPCLCCQPFRHFRCLWFEKGVVRVADRRGSVIAFRTMFVQWGVQADALDEVGICDVVPSERDEISESLPQEFGSVLPVDAHIENQSSMVASAEMMNHAVARQGGNGCLR